MHFTLHVTLHLTHPTYTHTHTPDIALYIAPPICTYLCTQSNHPHLHTLSVNLQLHVHLHRYKLTYTQTYSCFPSCAPHMSHMFHLTSPHVHVLCTLLPIQYFQRAIPRAIAFVYLLYLYLYGFYHLLSFPLTLPPSVSRLRLLRLTSLNFNPRHLLEVEGPLCYSIVGSHRRVCLVL